MSDVSAYVALGQLEERSGFFTAAVKYLRTARALGADDRDISGPLGRALVAQAHDDEALPELERAVALAPESTTAAVNLAGLYVRQNAPEEAATLLTRFARSHPPSQPTDAHRLALALLECGAEEPARALAKDILKRSPDDLIAQGIAARSALGARDFVAAITHLDALLAADPNDAGTHYLYGLALQGRGEDAAALKHWKTAVTRNPNALDAYERIGEVAARRKDVRLASQAYDALARRAPSPLNALRASHLLAAAGETERAAYWRAIGAGLTGDFTSALSQGTIAAASKDPAVHRLGLQAVAEAYRGLRKRELYLQTIQKLAPGNTVDDLLTRAHGYREADDHVRRTQYLQQAADRASDARKPAILVELAGAYRTRGMRDEAEKALEQALTLQPENAALHRELAGLVFERRQLDGRLERAVRGWERAISLDPTEADDWQSLGIAYSALGQTARAVTFLEHAIDLEPGSGPAYLELGRVTAKLGDTESSKRLNALYARFVAFDQTLQNLRTRARRPGASAPDIVAYGDLLLKMENLEEAAQQFQRALQLTPRDQPLRQRLANLYARLRQPEKRQMVLEGGR